MVLSLKIIPQVKNECPSYTGACICSILEKNKIYIYFTRKPIKQPQGKKKNWSHKADWTAVKDFGSETGERVRISLSHFFKGCVYVWVRALPQTPGQTTTFHTDS